MQKLVLVITGLETNEVLERWQFDIECDKSAKESRSASATSFSISETLFFLINFKLSRKTKINIRLTVTLKKTTLDFCVFFKVLV